MKKKNVFISMFMLVFIFILSSVVFAHSFPDQPICGSPYDITSSSFKVNCGPGSLGSYSQIGIYVDYRKSGVSGWPDSTSTQYFTSGFTTKTFTITGLDSSQLYQFRPVLVFSSVFCSGSGCTSGSNFGSISEVTTTQNAAVIPTVTSKAATSVGDTSATLNTDFTVGTYDEVDLRFFYRPTGGSWTSTSWSTRYSSGSLSRTVSGLLKGTEYQFYPQISYWSGDCSGSGCQTGSKTGTTRTFTTTGTPDQTPPTLTTLQPNTINQTSANLRGEITAINDATNIQYFFMYQENYFGATEYTTTKTGTSGTGIKSLTQSIFQEDTEYSYKFCLDYTLDGGSTTSCGSNIIFSTLESEQEPEEQETYNQLSLDMLPANNILSNFAQLRGQIVSLNGSTAGAGWFIYWKLNDSSNNITTNEQIVFQGNTPFNIFQNIYIDYNTTYEFTFCGSPYDNDLNLMNISCLTPYLNFTTLEKQGIEIITLPAESITTTSAKLKGSVYFDTNEYQEIDVYFKYKALPSGEYILITPIVQSPKGPMTIDYTLSPLQPGTTTYYKMCTNDDGVELCSENEENFTTLIQTGILTPPPTPGETDLDELWHVLTGGSTFARYIISFFLILSILFIGISAFGKYGIQIGMYGIAVFLFMGIVLTTLLGLTPWYVLGLFIIGPLIYLIISMSLGSNNGGM
jgi:hypothetical protein